MSREIENENKVCCADCGIKYLKDNNIKREGHAVTFSPGICCVCGEEKSTTSIRHYNNLQSNNETKKLP
jgi:hypothetical protein